jgi:hypothetical protein
VVEGSTADPEVGVTVYRTFKDDTSLDRYTLFVLEDGAWKHRFTAEENAIFSPASPTKSSSPHSNVAATADRTAARLRELGGGTDATR